MAKKMWHCTCVGAFAMEAAKEVAASETLPMRTYIKVFREQHAAELADPEVTPEKAEDLFVAWLHLVQPYWDAVHDAFQRHPLKEAPDPRCPLCGGTGLVETNPIPNAGDTED